MVSLPRLSSLVSLSFGLLLGAEALAQTNPAITFSEHIAPILYDNCVRCHRPGGVGPMSLVQYEEARPWAQVIKYKTGLRDTMGAMPPYYLERDIGIQQMKDDERLSEEEIALIAHWADNGAPQGDPVRVGEVPTFDNANHWILGEPDLVVSLDEQFVPAGAADSWIAGDPVPTGLTRDRYVRAVQMREVNDAGASALGDTVVGGLYVFHHMSWETAVANAPGGEVNWPVHELGRNPDLFDPQAGRLLQAGSSVIPVTYHLHSNGRDTTGHMEIGFYFHPESYQPEYKRGRVGLGDGLNISIQGNQANQELHTYTVLNEHTKISSFEPHLHAPGARMCLEAIWGNQIETLACAGYDHNWVKQYTFADDYAPLLPKGTVLHMIGFMDNIPGNPNVVDPRNWSGSGNRSVTNMFIDLGMRVTMNEEQFMEEMAERRRVLNMGPNDHVIGCPLCGAPLVSPMEPTGDDAD